MKRLLLITAAIAALTSPATALELGKNIRFNQPRPIAVGCTNSNDAVRVAKMHRQNDEYAIQEFVEWMSNSKSSEHTCIILNDSPDNSWKVVKLDPVNGRGGQWACLQAQYDFRPEAEQNEPAPCLWIYMPSVR